MRRLAMLFLATLVSTSAFADGNKTIFSCTTKTGKPLTVQQIGSDYELAFNDTKLKNSIKQVMSNDYSIIASRSGYILSSLDFTKDGKTSYFIQYQESMGDAKPLFAGVFLTQDGGEPKKITECNLKRKIHANFDYKIMPQSGTGF